ncbi:MAG: hypothetical protein VXZ39_12655, partial [Planctomycetota bacterium]|nr:hypothetical protein [Planctomycetota bacterium]
MPSRSPITERPFEWRPEELRPGRFEAVLPDVFRAPLVTAAGCARFLEELDRRRAEAPRGAPNSMHEHGVMLTPLGLDGAVEGLLGPAAGLRALLAERFGDVGGGSIDGWHSYIVEYA